MSNQFLMLFAYLLIILNIHKTNQLIFGIPEESSFIPLNSRQIVKFELTPQQSEIYYSFQNEYKDSDIIINLKVGKGFTSKCYIYDSYEKIETNSQGEYIHHLAELSLTEKTLLLKNTEYLISKTKYYIIIKDIVNSYNKDYISIFNEKDIIELESEKYISIEKYYSQNAYYFHFSHKKDEVVSIELNTDVTGATIYCYLYNNTHYCPGTGKCEITYPRVITCEFEGDKCKADGDNPATKYYYEVLCGISTYADFTAYEGATNDRFKPQITVAVKGASYIKFSFILLLSLLVL